MTPPQPQQEISAPAPVSSGGIQNWRYSEFISAVEKDKVEKVPTTSFHICLFQIDKADLIQNSYRLLSLLTAPSFSPWMSTAIATSWMLCQRIRNFFPR